MTARLTTARHGTVRMAMTGAAAVALTVGGVLPAGADDGAGGGAPGVPDVLRPA